MKTALSGASGFLGSGLTARLLGEGPAWSVRVSAKCSEKNYPEGRIEKMRMWANLNI